MEGPDLGHVVYFIVCDEFVKVGYSNKVRARLKELQTANPKPLRLVCTKGYETKAEALEMEAEWRKLLASWGKPAKGEWVELRLNTIQRLISSMQPPRGKNLAEIIADGQSFNGCVVAEALTAYGLRCYQ